MLPATASGIVEAAALLRAGELVAFPTETVYGLGADATQARAVAGIYAAKQRPSFNPLIVHCADADAAFALVVPGAAARILADTFWPGPLTLVLPRRAGDAIADLAAAGLGTLAVRVPAHPVALALLRATGRPLAAPSANPSGRISPTTAGHVLDGLRGRIAAVLGGGHCEIGLESTVLDLATDPPVLLRPGAITEAMLSGVLGATPDGVGGRDSIRAPGQLRSHYAPACPVRLDAREAAGDEALLAFGPPPSGAAAVFQLSASRDLAEAAAALFAGLRALEADVARLGLARIACMPVPCQGLGLAINDRLSRAAAR